MPNVDLCDSKCLSETASKRTTLLFFRGRLKRNAVRFLCMINLCVTGCLLIVWSYSDDTIIKLIHVSGTNIYRLVIHAALANC